MIAAKKNRLLKSIFSIGLLLMLLVPLSVLAANDERDSEDAIFVERKVALTDEEQAYLKEQPTVIMVADTSWRPLEYVNDKKEYAGVIYEITRKIEARTGLHIEYKLMDSYAEALEAVRNGEADMISGLAADDNLAKEYNVMLSKPYLTINSAVVSNKALTNIYSETERKRIAVIDDDYANADIKNKIANAELIKCSSNEECLEKVRKGEVDMAIIAAYCAEYYLSIPEYSEFHNHSIPDLNWKQAFGVSAKADPRLLSILNKGVSELSPVEINEAVYKGIIEAEYSNDLLKFIYKHPLLVIGGNFFVAFFIGSLIFFIYKSKKKEQLRKLEDGVRLKLALGKTQLCIWEIDIATKRIVQIDNEQEKHGFYELRENIPYSVIEKGYVHPEDIQHVRDVVERVLNGEQDVQGCWRIKEKAMRGNDTLYWWEQVLFHIVFDENHKPIKAIGVSEDVTKEKNAQLDALTSVYNRSSFEEKAKLILNERRNFHLQCAFLILDLDGFKQINDTYGHGMGDRVLIAVGETLSKTFRSTDIVGRMGGDEFTVFMKSINKREDVMRKSDELVRNISKIAEKEGFPFAVSCSLGGNVEVKGKDDLATMYRKADLALYEAKRAGKNQYRLYAAPVKKKILLVDDIEVNREILKNILTGEFEVLEAENGVRALTILAEHDDIDMVITDIMMPEMNGIELIKQIRSQEKYRNMAIIAETHHDDLSIEAEILPLGVDDFIHKAASPMVIQKRVENIMKAKEY